jgi:hypothetical protein
MPISTRDLSGLPEPITLERLVRALAMLDAIMSPDWQYRYFLYNPHWGDPLDERMASLDNGSGDNYFLVFSKAGAFLKGFDHESEMTPWAFDPIRIWPGVLSGVPEEFQTYLTEPAFDMESTTFCIWRRPGDHFWQRGEIEFPDLTDDPDGSQSLLWMLDGNPSTYVKFAKDYYEKEVSLDSVQAIYGLAPLRPDIIAALNSELAWDDAVASAKEIPYPTPG